MTASGRNPPSFSTQKKNPAKRPGPGGVPSGTIGNVYSADTGVRAVITPSRFVPSGCTGSCATSLSSKIVVHAANPRQTPSGSQKKTERTKDRKSAASGKSVTVRVEVG